MKLELLKVKIEKERLLKVPAPERAFYLKALNFLTDVSIIQKSCWHSIPQKDALEPLKQDAANNKGTIRGQSPIKGQVKIRR